ncbi:alpha/beta fold hydrolase [Novosphingobium sp. FSY-8]|uniref:Alpha/beta fold hydrolase n=1 Tax=Novosphingobium ovatum TaxID=1908523 RepID=A0ABW9XAV9_9SPHN|nr:alpha/beta fold hydrolase [Novosphingobium ovatum]NBC35667.1 alpha/beta fold hydrolase [Novosphingobium ovatum]
MNSSLRPVRLASGMQLAVWESSPPRLVQRWNNRPALIFLHGFPENHRTWRHQIGLLSQTHRCIAPDLRGFGASDKPQDPREYTTAKLVRDVFELANAMQIDRFILIGHDWGGVIAWYAAMLEANLPEKDRRIQQLVVANAPHPAVFQQLLFTDPAQRAAAQYITLLRDRAIDAQVAAEGIAPLLVRAFGAGTFSAMEQAERALLLQQWRSAETGIAMLNLYRASDIIVPSPAAPPDVPAQWQAPPYPRLSVPTQVLWGMADPVLLPANLDGMEAHCSQLHITRLPQAGHFAPWQSWSNVNSLLKLPT